MNDSLVVLSDTRRTEIGRVERGEFLVVLGMSKASLLSMAEHDCINLSQNPPGFIFNGKRGRVLVLVKVSLGSIPATGGAKHNNIAKAPMRHRIHQPVGVL